MSKDYGKTICRYNNAGCEENAHLHDSITGTVQTVTHSTSDTCWHRGEEIEYEHEHRPPVSTEIKQYMFEHIFM